MQEPKEDMLNHLAIITKKKAIVNNSCSLAAMFFFGKWHETFHMD